MDFLELLAKAKMFDEMVEILKKTFVVIHPKRIIKSGPATIVIWEDGSKTVVKIHDGDKDDLHTAFCAAVTKKVYGSNSKLKKVLEKTETIHQ